MNVHDPMMLGYDPGNKYGDYITSAYDSKVCGQLLQSTWSSKNTTSAGSASDPNDLNQRNAAAAEQIYSPLLPGAMRLLKLHRGIGKIQCSVLSTLEEKVPQYEALSYVWGCTNDPHSITLDGFDYLVTRNLFEVLLRLRKSDEDRILWIDALVINQSDNAERSKEVTRMLDRYSRASNSIVWLGEPMKGATYGRLDIISAMTFLSQPDLTLPKDYNREEWGPIKQAVEAIFCSIYWTRAWTVQEIMYSHHVTLHYGSKSLAMDAFLRFVDVNSHVGEMTPFRSIVIGDRRVSLRPGYGEQEKYLRIPSWLGCYLRHRDCTNPKDCLFAYYGCFSPEARKHIVTDYERSPLEMAIDITFAWISSERNLDFLLEIGCRESCWRRPDIPNEQCVPSWMPSYFGKQTNCTGRVVAGPDVPQTRPPVSKAIVRFPTQSNAMYVKGVLLGTIESVGTPNLYPISHFKPFESFLLHHLRRAKGQISALDRGLKEAIQVHYHNRNKAGEEYSETIQIMEEDSRAPQESLNETNEFQLRMAESMCSYRTAFSYRQWPGSRPIQTSKVDVPFGLGTEGLKPDDVVFVIVGCSTPLILRPVGSFHIVIGNSKMFSFLDGVFLQEHIAMFPPGIFVDITLR